MTAHVAEPALPSDEPMPPQIVEYWANNDATNARLTAIATSVGTPALVAVTEMANNNPSTQPWVEAVMTGTEGLGILLGAVGAAATVVYRTRARRGWAKAGLYPVPTT